MQVGLQVPLAIKYFEMGTSNIFNLNPSSNQLVERYIQRGQ